jgi:hypothetical protein
MPTDNRQLRDRRDYARTFDGMGNLDIQGQRNIWHEKLDLSSWDDEDDVFAELWNEGKSLFAIAEFFNRDTDEVMIWAIHLARLKRLRKRIGYLWGVNS